MFKTIMCFGFEGNFYINAMYIIDYTFIDWKLYK